MEILLLIGANVLASPLEAMAEKLSLILAFLWLHGGEPRARKSIAAKKATARQTSYYKGSHSGSHGGLTNHYHLWKKDKIPTIANANGKK